MNKERLKLARRKAGLRQSDLAELVHMSQGTVASWENGTRDPDTNMLITLSHNLGVTVGWLLGQDETAEKPNRIPVLGRIPAGIPIEAVEEVIDWEDIPSMWMAGGKEYFALRIRGDSMYPEYLSGDTIILRKTETCESGDDCAVMVNGDEATFKRIRLTESGMILQPLNPAYEPMAFTAEQVASLPVRILGVEVELRRSKKRR